MIDDRYRIVGSYFGPMAVLDTDTRIGEEISRLGHWEFEEFIEIMKLFDRFYQNPSGVFVDVGCNVGAFMLPLARRFRNQILGFDCQEPLTIAANKTFLINHLDNAHADTCVISDQITEIQMPSIDYNHQSNFGSHELEPPYQNSDTNVQSLNNHYSTIPVRTLDSLISSDVAFIKIDVEGMEHKVLMGARGIIARSRPFLTLENHKTDFNFVCDMLYSLEYRLETVVREMAVFIPKGKTIL